MSNVDPGFWRGRSVLLTGHTGFKGAWCALWLARMGARVTGLALAPETEPSLFVLAGIGAKINSRIGDIRDRDCVRRIVAGCDPEIVLHLAAQPFVRRSVREPVETIATNVLGTAHLLDALRDAPSLACVLVVTTDKVYENANNGASFRESDPLGGSDPYAASKSATEFIARAFAATYFETRGIPIATARGGNVVGGGDFAEDRLVPDIIRAVMKRESVALRYPEATRPWQHVLDCVAGYLIYAQRLVEDPQLPRSLNFGPDGSRTMTVGTLTNLLLSAFGVTSGWVNDHRAGPKEATLLSLDTSLARKTLGWRDCFAGEAALTATAEWYKIYAADGDIAQFTLEQINKYMAMAGSQHGPLP